MEKEWPSVDYEVGREKIREYANAVGESDPVHQDREAARSAGFRDVVAPPMFAVVYSAGAVAPAMLDPAVGMNLAVMVHGGQEFAWSELVYAGDTITTTAAVRDLDARESMRFYVFESVSVNQDGLEGARGTWTNIERGG